ncbi:MAG: tetratricopeptide repeat protein [Chloroflexota bacterium]
MAMRQETTHYFHDPPNHVENISLPITTLIGREQELTTICETIRRDDVRLLTLNGPGGVGKTRLALHLAALVQYEFRDGVVFVPLAPIHDSQFVLPTIAQALELRESHSIPQREHLQQFLRNRQMLLILDNFEQVIDAAPLVADLLRTCPYLKIVVTSRTVLRISGENRFVVPPLSLPHTSTAEQPTDLATLQQSPALSLFVERARAANPDFTLDAENAPVVSEICTRLDGFPLAIELAAAWLRLLEPQELLTRLNNRLNVLTGGARDLPAHQQTLRRTLDWSYDLLVETEKQLFTQLGVFVSGCSLEAAEAVCQLDTHPEEPLLDHLVSLLDKSMLFRADSHGSSIAELRFGMLETIREYALEQLLAGDGADAVYQHHAAYYLDLAERAEPELLGPSQEMWLKRLEQEHDNLRAALQWALEQYQTDTVVRIAGAIWRFWHVHGHLLEGRQWLDIALDISRDLHSMARVKVLCGAGWLANVQGNITQAASFFDEGLTLSRALNDTSGIGMALSGLGRMAHLQGDHERAVPLYEESLEILRRLGDTKEIAWTLMRLGILAMEQHTYDRATTLLEESLDCFRSVSFTWGITWSLMHLGRVALEQEDYARATDLYKESLHYFQQLGDKSSIATTMVYLGRAALAQHDSEQALAFCHESLQLYQQIGEQLGIAECLELMARIRWAHEQNDQSVRLLGAAEQLRSQLSAGQSPVDQNWYSRIVQQMQNQLGRSGFEDAWEEGTMMELDQLVCTPTQTEAPLPDTLTPPASVSPATDAATTAKDPTRLTSREIEVLRLVSTGLTDAQVADQLCVSTRTVNAHLRSIYSKLGVSSRSAVTRLAIEQQLV